jgi:hypothetical protein
MKHGRGSRRLYRRHKHGTLTVKVTADLDAIGGWNPQDVAEVIDSSVSQLEGVGNVEFPGSVACAADSR